MPSAPLRSPRLRRRDPLVPAAPEAPRRAAPPRRGRADDQIPDQAPGRARLLGAAILLLSLALFGGLRLADLSARSVLHHDDGISLIAAAATETRFAEALSTASGAGLMPAAPLADLLRAEPPPSWSRIAEDMSAGDIHPPLYFWALAQARALAGPGTDALHAGLALNLAASLGAILLLRAAARRLAGPVEASLAAALFALPPAMAGALVSRLRPYEMLQLAETAALFCAVALWQARGGRGRAAAATGLALATAAALSLHLQAALFCAALGAAALLRGGAEPRGRLAAAALIAGGLAALGLNPGILAMLDRHEGLLSPQAPALALAGAWAARLLAGLGAIGREGATPLWAPAALLVAATAAAALALGLRGRIGGGPQDGAGGRETLPPEARLLMLAGVATTLLVAAQFIAGAAPAHAAGGRYMLVFWAPLSLALWLVLRRLRGGRIAAAAIALLFGLASAVDHRAAAPAYRAEADAGRILAEAPQAFSMVDRRGTLTPLLAGLRPGARLSVLPARVPVDAVAEALRGAGPGDALLFAVAGGVGATLRDAQLEAARRIFLLDETRLADVGVLAKVLGPAAAPR